MSADTKLIMGALLASAVIMVGAAFVLSKDASPKRERMGTASMAIDKRSEDFGNMKADEEKTATFVISNTGNSTLRIWGVVTSCNCTFATVVINGVGTGEFNMPMHTSGRLKNWIGEVPVGQTATLTATYRPKVMPVKGPVSRQVRFSTNDPKNPELEVSIQANVL